MEEQQDNECHPWPEEIPSKQLALASSGQPQFSSANSRARS